MELRYLRYFVTVADRQNFTRAAEELHVAQPAISQQIKALEDELGVTLLLRTKRSVRLSAAGTAFLAEAREILLKAEMSKQVARRAARGEIGSLSIGCFSSSVSAFLPKLVQAYCKKYPSVRVHLHEMSPDQQRQAFVQERIDVGFTRPLASSVSRDFIQERVYSDRLVLALPSTHPRARDKGSVQLDSMADANFVMFKRSEAPELVDGMIQLCAKAGFSPRIVGEAPMMQTVLMAVASGIGISLVPACVRAMAQKGVSFATVSPVSPEIQLVAVSRKKENSPIIKAWMEVLRLHLPEIRRMMEAKGSREAAQ